MNSFNTVAILLNGPPGIGKDTLADIICLDPMVNKMEYKAGLRRATAQRYRVDQKLADYYFADRIHKDNPSRHFEGLSPRDALIETDTYLKKKFGKSMVGEWAAQDVQDAIQIENKRYFLFSDSGFVPEAMMVAEKVDFMIVINLFHPEYNFDNDSRDYIKVDGVNSCTVAYHRLDGDPKIDAQNINALISDTLWEHRSNK